MNTTQHKATLVKRTNMGFYKYSRYVYRGYEIDFTPGRGYGYPWTFYPTGQELNIRGIDARSKKEAIAMIDEMIESGKLIDRS
jgi:hypothetical protein